MEPEAAVAASGSSKTATGRPADLRRSSARLRARMNSHVRTVRGKTVLKIDGESVKLPRAKRADLV